MFKEWVQPFMNLLLYMSYFHPRNPSTSLYCKCQALSYPSSALQAFHSLYKPTVSLLKGASEITEMPIIKILIKDCLAKELWVYIRKRRFRLAQARWNIIGFHGLRGSYREAVSTCTMFKDKMNCPDRQWVSYHQSKQVDVCYIIFLTRKALKFIF